MTLRFDGFYKSPVDDEGNCTYLRFYEDGMVISTCTSGHERYLEDIVTWFSRQTYKEDVGNYMEEETEIEFSITINIGHVGHEGLMHYKGIIGTDELILDMHSEITDHKQQDQKFTFIPITGMTGK